MNDEFLAHTAPDGRLHVLEDHLRAVAVGAAETADRFGSSEWARFAGLWHDLGKFRPGFQEYIRQSRDSDSHIENRVAGREKTHSAAGALWSSRCMADSDPSAGPIVARVLSYLIAGHHAGLDNWHDGLKPRLEGADAKQELADALSATPADSILRPAIPLPSIARIPVDAKTGIPGSFALWVRMLFSSLVDADFLDTEAFMDQAKGKARTGFVSISEMLEKLDAHMLGVAKNAQPTPINDVRAGVLRQCSEKAKLAPGVFTLTVPTGGGKTLSSLAFALRHAAIHHKRRVIYAIPYTSIIEQTADVFRAIVGDRNLVEHHSNAETDPSTETHRSRLACENWDAPLIVTTNVQLFESLFSRRTSRCRKLHGIVDSVIVLDEAQLLPLEFLQPVLDALQLLVSDYGVTLVLCTATQPALVSRIGFDPRHGLRGFKSEQVTPIIDDEPVLYETLRRVDVVRPQDFNEKREWSSIAGDILRHESVLAIVNRRADAGALYRELKAQGANDVRHLSALMCPQHRSDAIAAIKQDLARYWESKGRGERALPVRVVSTQLVEAGVDLDFPAVFRAMAGLDSIAQAAGRCNREGRLEKGVVHVFVPPTLPPPGLLRQAESACRTVWAGATGEALDPKLFSPYFQHLYGDGNLDRHGICDFLEWRRGDTDLAIDFRSASDAFRLIDDKDAATVIVRYPVKDSGCVDQWIAMVERDGPERWLMRKLQRFSVSIYKHDASRLLSLGDIRELAKCPGLYVQVSDLFYNAIMGAVLDGAPGDPAVFFVD